MNKTLLSLILSLLLAPGVAAAGQPTAEAALRDLRPTKLQRGEKAIVEASGPIFTVGAPTTVSFAQLLDVGGQPVTLQARATSKDRIVFDADERLEVALGGEHRRVLTSVSVSQTIDGKVYTHASDPRDLFELDLYPASLFHLAQELADAATGGKVFAWLGMTVKAAPKGGVLVADLEQAFSADDAIRAYDTPPIDAAITRDEAKRGGMAEAEFLRLDHDGSGVIEHHELKDAEREDGMAAAAGLLVNDVVTKVDGQAISSVAELEAAWRRPGDKLTLEVSRAGGTASIDLPRTGVPASVPAWLIWALVLAAAAGIVALPVPLIAGLVVVWERKVSAYMQSRLGPNRVGPGGWLQWLADGLKLIMKEDIIPTEADPVLFRMSPYLAFIGMFLTFMVLPFSHLMIVADLNIGLLFLLSVTSLVVVSIIMGGWSSNSKWSLLGGMRSAAQIISYELPASVALLGIATMTGSLSTQSIVRAQGGWPWEWYLFANPFTLCAFFIYFISSLAEGNRTPFDLPEAESELVSGFNTEYSGFRFSLFPMVEWVNVFIIAGITTMLFLGGWQIPGVSVELMEQHAWLDLVGFLVFLAKDIALIFVIIWIRWTLPRFRVDQMMNLCWKYFIPTSFACFVGVLAWTWLVPEMAQTAMKLVMFAVFGLGFGLWFAGRVRYNSKRYQDLVINEALGRVNG